MRNRLWVLNFVLIAVVVYAAVEFRGRWNDTHTRQSKVLAQRVRALPAPPFTPLPMEPPVTPATYAQIAMRTLFDPTRNPNVIVEKPAPPPPPPMPPLPLCFGVMNLGDGPAAILAENAKSMHQFLHPGQTVGQFKLLDVNTDEIVLEWNGQQVRKPVMELAVAAANEQPQGPAMADNSPPPPPPAPVKAGPGEDTGRGWKICNMNDGVAEGATVDGHRKVVYATPFGTSCRYEPVQ